MPVSQRVIIFIEVMAMSRAIPATFSLPPPDCVLESKCYMTQTPSFNKYQFINHLKSTTPYLLISYPIFHHNQPPEADIDPSIHEQNLEKLEPSIIVINVFEK